MGIAVLTALGLWFWVYSLFNVGDFTSKIRIVIHVAGYFLAGMDDRGMVSAPQLLSNLG